MRIVKRVRQFLAELQAADGPGVPFSPADKLVVAVSGGPDSLALLHMLSQGGLHPTENLIVAHLNHALREEADAEAQFVMVTASSWRLSSKVKRADVIGLARDEGLSLEEAGRQARYRFLAKVAREYGARFVATGHNADDQAETVLMHLLRGAGYGGLRGMLPIGPLPGASDLTVVRPFLDVERSEIEEYCRQQGLQPVIDATNEEVTFFRNRVRHELLPLLAEYSAQIKRRLQQLATLVTADYELIAELAEEAWSDILIDEGPGWLKLDRLLWRSLPLALRRLTLRRAVQQLDPGPTGPGFRTIEQARRVAERLDVGGKASLPGNVVLQVGYETLELRAEGANVALPDLPQLPAGDSLPLPVPGRVRLAGDWVLEASPATGALSEIELGRGDPWIVHVDPAQITELVVRPRRPGERFQPLGMKGKSGKVKEVMIDRKIPARLRSRWPIVATPDHLVWLVGHHLDHRVRLTESSQAALRLAVKRAAALV